MPPSRGNNDEPLPSRSRTGSYVGDENDTKFLTNNDVNMSEQSDTMTVPQGNGEAQDCADHIDCFNIDASSLIKAVRRLENMGIDATIQSLPKFVVVGDQSHGKSSIVEAVCDITVPRSAGTCTRCPTQITTTEAKHGEQWKCEISLAFRFQYDNQPRLRKDSEPWRDTGEPNIVPFTVVHHRSQLEHKLRLAQIAILNPQTSPAQILANNNVDEVCTVSFSPNIIRLDIRAPGLSELSFFDLPGAINVHYDSNEKHVVSVIEKLIKLYLQDEKALILLAISANQDIETSTACRYVTESEANERCMGVFTKADLITVGNRQIPKVLKGEIYQLGHSWYVTKQLSQEELDDGVSHSEARQREETFFATQKPWSSSLSVYAAHFGTQNLQYALSQKLKAHIVEELPTIKSRVLSRLSEVENTLAGYPEQAKAPCQTVSNEIYELQSLVRKKLAGEGLEKKFRNEYKGVLTGLRKQLQDAKPKIVFATPGFEQPAISLDDASASEDESPSKRAKNNTGRAMPVPSTPLRAKLRTARNTKAVANSEPETNTSPQRHMYTLDSLQTIYNDGSVSGVPDQVDNAVTEQLALDFTAHWSVLTTNALAVFKDKLATMLCQSTMSSLKRHDRTKLFEETMKSIQEQLDELIDQMTGWINRLMACESLRPITYTSTWSQKVIAQKRELESQRLKVRGQEHFDTLDATMPRPTPSAERDKKLNDLAWLTANLPADPYAREVQWIALPLAYYDVASERLLDNIATHIEFGLLHALGKGLRERLEIDLHANESEYCAQLLAADPERERQRRQLIAEQQKLLEAMKELDALSFLR